MEKTLGDFVLALRRSDVPVSPAESLDAMSAMALIGVENRRLLHDTLALILAKSPEEKALFDVCFDRFFSFHQFGNAGPATADVPSETATAGGGPDLSAADKLEQPPASKRRRRDPPQQAHHHSKLGHLLLEDDQSELALLMVRAAAEVKLERIRTLRERSLFVRRILVHMGMSLLESEIERLRQSGDELAALTAYQLTEAARYLTEQVREFVEEQYYLLVDGSGTRFLTEAVTDTRLTNMQPYYFDHIREAVRKLANQLAKRHAKRRKVVNRGQLDVKRTLRSNLQYDGALFDIKWKQTRLERPKVFVICDVSGSVKNISRFLLTFLYSLGEVLPKVRSFAFSNELGEVTDIFDRYPLEEAIEMSLDDYGKGATDYGLAFKRFRELALRDLDNRSTVIVLGDSRNNYYDSGEAALKQIASKARQVIWLNPEPRDKWEEGDAEMQTYLPYCDFADVCNSLPDLERMVTRVLQSAH